VTSWLYFQPPLSTKWYVHCRPCTLWLRTPEEMEDSGKLSGELLLSGSVFLCSMLLTTLVTKTRQTSCAFNKSRPVHRFAHHRLRTGTRTAYYATAGCCVAPICGCRRRALTITYPAVLLLGQESGLLSSTGILRGLRSPTVRIMPEIQRER
jgi:hypothetical protein